MGRGIVLSDARLIGRVIKQRRVNGNDWRKALAPQYAPNSLSPVLVVSSEQGLFNNWERRFLRTTQTHLVYPSLIYAGQRLLGDRHHQVQVGGATFQAMTAKGGNQNGYLFGNQAAHLNLGSAKINGKSLVRSVADLLYKTPDAATLAPHLCRLTVAGIALEGDIAVQASFLNQTDAAIEDILHREFFSYLAQFSSEIRPEFLVHANQMVLNTSVQAIANGTVESAAERVFEGMRSGKLTDREQHPDCSGSALVGGRSTSYLDFLLSNDVLRVSRSELFRAVSANLGDVNAVSGAIQDEVLKLEEVNHEL